MKDKEIRAKFIYLLCKQYTRNLLDSGKITEEQFHKINKRCSEYCTEIAL